MLTLGVFATLTFGVFPMLTVPATLVVPCAAVGTGCPAPLTTRTFCVGLTWPIAETVRNTQAANRDIAIIHFHRVTVMASPAWFPTVCFIISVIVAFIAPPQFLWSPI